MKMFALLSCTAAVVVLAGAANRAEAQYGYGGTLRYGPGYRYPVRRPSVTTYRGPLGGRVTVAQGPFGGGAVSLRGPLGGRLNIGRPGYVPVVPYAVPYAPVPTVVQQTVLNPAPNPNWPYSPAYLARIPPGYPSLEIGASPYLYTPLLPPGSQPVAVGGVTLYANNGVFYQPYFLGGQMVYLVVER